MKVRTPLTRDWTLRLDTTRHRPDHAPAGLADAEIPAQVPGCVHTDLLAAGLIPDPYLDRNEQEVAWVGRADWTYTTALPAAGTGHERTDLVFDGLDTVAEIRLGDRLLGATRNMHRSYRYDVTDLLGDGNGSGAGPETGPGAGTVPLSVRFTSAYEEAEALRQTVGARPNAYPEPFNFVRKMACSFGWDWGPTLVTAGIWRQARLEHWSVARLADVTPEVTVRDGVGRVLVRVAVERTGSGASRPLTVGLTVAGRSARVELPAGQDTGTVEVTVPGAELWWPRGYGEQPLYDCEVVLTDADGTALDGWERRVGFRTVELDTAADEHGSAFTLVVNGTRLFARGVNWIPDDVFPSRITPARYRHRLEQAAAAGVDLVRVWGGGIYEDRAFYDACDELGLMVWQDFLFACAAYPEDEPLRGEIAAEAAENVTRLMPHPSLVLWNGNNENLWGFADWEWAAELDGAAWGEGYYLDLLPRIVASTDPTRPYWAGSPWSGSWEHHPNDPGHGTAHSWEVWNRADYTDYTGSVPRFVAEFGWQAPPAYATLRRALSDTPLSADSPGMAHHQKADDGNGKLDRGLAHHFPVPEDFDAWHYLTQVNQARAVATGVEHWRSHWPTCAGTVLWQLNDCWPVTSWAAIDGDARPKPLYHELSRLYADRLLTFQQRDGRTVLAAVNQGAQRWTSTVLLRRVDADGTVHAKLTAVVDAAPRSVALVPLPEEIAVLADPGREFRVADADGLRAVHFDRTDAEFGYPQADMQIELVPGARRGADAEVTVRARTLLRDLLLQADRLHPDARADRGLVTLLPGESVTYRVSDWQDADAQRLPGALLCVNSPRVLPSTRQIRR
ncbi:glycoside hydrolase family 2 protein [Streptomyces sp. CA-111067]|uniref:glycoside hydrolase family 2 protein n=1 Tax=Streptomyces sp. CA-111067 TaxID=3240046 RepID=UPI003D97E961